MTTLHRLVINWTGPQVVGSAVTVLHFSGSDNSAPPVGAVEQAFWSHSSLFPTGVTITVPNSGDSIDDRTGQLTGVWTATGGAAVSGTGNAKAARGVGACIGWETGGIVNGRKLRGRTFLVPLTTDAYDTDGTLLPTALQNVMDTANAIQASGPLAIWHRPTTKGGSDGNSYGVGANRVRDRVAFLSSRRD